MARRREINQQEAEVLANLGHKIHYYYDPAEPVGRHSSKARNGAVTAKVKRHRPSSMITLTSQKISKNIRSTRKQAARVYDAARKILTAQGAGAPLSRNTLCELLAVELNKTNKAVQIQVTLLLRIGYLNAEFPAT